MALKNISATCYHALTRNICIKAICTNNLRRYTQLQTHVIWGTFTYHAEPQHQW